MQQPESLLLNFIFYCAKVTLMTFKNILSLVICIPSLYMYFDSTKLVTGKYFSFLFNFPFERNNSQINTEKYYPAILLLGVFPEQ